MPGDPPSPDMRQAQKSRALPDTTDAPGAPFHKMAVSKGIAFGGVEGQSPRLAFLSSEL